MADAKEKPNVAGQPCQPQLSQNHSDSWLFGGTRIRILPLLFDSPSEPPKSVIGNFAAETLKLLGFNERRTTVFARYIVPLRRMCVLSITHLRPPGAR